MHILCMYELWYPKYRCLHMQLCKEVQICMWYCRGITRGVWGHATTGGGGGGG